MNDLYEVTVAATEEPVTSLNAKDFLRIDLTDDDEIVNALITACTNQLEKYTNRVFVQRTFKGSFSLLQLSDFEEYPYVQIRRAPLVSITSVKAMVGGELVDISSDNYQLKEKNGFSRILFTESISCDDVPYPLEVIFVAGFGAASAVPQDIKTAIKQYMLFLYENRGDVLPDGNINFPVVTQAIADKYRIVNTFG